MLGVLLGWFAFTVVFAIAWSRLHAHARELEGIDEDAYINGRQWSTSEAMQPSHRTRGRPGQRITQPA